MNPLLSFPITVYHNRKLIPKDLTTPVLDFETSKDRELLARWTEENILKKVWNTVCKKYTDRTCTEAPILNKRLFCMFIPELCYHQFINDDYIKFIPKPIVNSNYKIINLNTNIKVSIDFTRNGQDGQVHMMVGVIWDFKEGMNTSTMRINIWSYFSPDRLQKIVSKLNICLHEKPIPRVVLPLKLLQLEIDHLPSYVKSMKSFVELVETESEQEEESEDEEVEYQEDEEEEEEEEIQIPPPPETEVPKPKPRALKRENSIVIEEELKLARRELLRSICGLSLGDDGRQHKGTGFNFIFCDGKIIHHYEQRMTTPEIAERYKSRMEVLYALYMKTPKMTQYLEKFTKFDDPNYLAIDETVQVWIAAALCHRRHWIRMFIEGEIALFECIFDKMQTKQDLLAFLSHTDHEMLTQVLKKGYLERIKSSAIPDEDINSSVSVQGIREILKDLLEANLKQLVDSWIELYQVDFRNAEEEPEEEEEEEHSEAIKPCDDIYNMELSDIEQNAGVFNYNSIPYSKIIVQAGVQTDDFMQSLFTSTWQFMSLVNIDY